MKRRIPKMLWDDSTKKLELLGIFEVLQQIRKELFGEFAWLNKII